VPTIGGDFEDTAAGSYPDLSMSFQPLACQHCATPACLAVCPVEAIIKDPDNGIVHQDNSVCIGCKLCIEACPYSVRVFLDAPINYSLDFAVGDPDAASHTENTVEKCSFCSNLIEKDASPRCVEACVGYARFFGDIDDPSSEVSKLIAERGGRQLLAERGTNPSVYYLD
jgi:molybdopterin-containing oxidoreductase family iron-sulfur binding subunit